MNAPLNMPDLSNPFPGLRCFLPEEDYLFFGRHEQIEDLLRRLRMHRMVSVVETSGSGKSSLVRAGLLPAIMGGGMSQAGSDWEIAVMRPGGNPLIQLAKALCDAGLYDAYAEDALFHLLATLNRSLPAGTWSEHGAFTSNGEQVAMAAAKDEIQCFWTNTGRPVGPPIKIPVWLGALLYRAGRFEESAKALQTGMSLHPDGGTFHDWLFLALAEHQLNHNEAAKVAATKAKSAKTSFNTGSVWDRTEVELLTAEMDATFSSSEK